jgi:hypothetical protein
MTKMKIRKGFVSNSSSSSFIIATPKDKKELKILVELDLSELTESSANSKEELLEIFKEEYSMESEEEIKESKYMFEWYQKALKAIEEGKTVHYGRVSSESDDGTELFLYNNGFGKPVDIDIIKDAGDD